MADPVRRVLVAGASGVIGTAVIEHFAGLPDWEGPVDELMISGGCSLTPNLQQVLRDRFEVTTELMNPLRRVHYKESDFDSGWLQSIAPMMSVAVGLAIRKAGD